MILDLLKNAALYTALGPGIAQAFELVCTTDFSQMAPGKYEVDGDNLFYMVNAYATKNSQDCTLEAHQRYIDLQYMVEGSELIGYTPLQGQPVATTPPPGEDCLFYQGEASFVLLDQGMFAIFFPDDLHMPCVRAKHEQVRKVVVKIRV